MVASHATKYIQIAFLSLLLISLPSFCADEKEEVFHGESIRVLESAYERAPRVVHKIVESLTGERKGSRCYAYNYAIFDGEPGVGKSTLAIAVAYKSGREVHKFSTSDFMTEATRNGTSVEFNDIVRGIENIEKKTVFILNEINHLLMNYDSKHHDTDASAMSLWTFLDKINGNKNLFFIGTTNGIGGFPPQMLSRLESAIVLIEVSKDLHLLRNIFFEYLKRKDITISDEAMQYVNESQNFLDGYDSRRIKHLVEKIIDKSEEPMSKDELVIRSEHIKLAFDDLVNIRVRAEKKPYNETDIEQREKHHQESLGLSKEQYRKSMEHQNILAANQRFLTYTSLAVGMTITVAGTAATIYFANRNQEAMMRMQETMHASTMAMQQLLHAQAIETQKFLHNNSIQVQKALHAQAMLIQKILQEKSLSAQQGANDKSTLVQGLGVGINLLDFGWRAYLWYTGKPL